MTALDKLDMENNSIKYCINENTVPKKFINL